SAEPVDLAAIVLDPVPVAEKKIVENRGNRDVARVAARGVCGEAKGDALAGKAFTNLVDVLCGGEFADGDREQVFALTDVLSGLAEWNPFARIPLLAVIDPLEPVPAVGHCEVRAQQPDFFDAFRSFVAARNRDVTDPKLAEDLTQ